MRKRPKAPRHCFWNGAVLWGRQTIGGQKRRWSLRTDDVKVAAQAVEADRKRNLERAHHGAGRVTWEEAVIGWADTYLKDRAVADTTATRYAVSLEQMAPWLRGTYVDEVDMAVVKKIVAARRAQGVTSATIRRDLGALGSVLSHCKAEGLRADNPALERLEQIREKRDPIVLPDPAHVARVIERAPGLIAAIVPAALATGCRLSELVNAERTWLDHPRREFTVIGKRNKRRTISLDYAGGYELLRDLPARLGCRWLFWHGDGEPYRNLSSRFAALAREVFLAAYDARHGTTDTTRPPLARLLEAQDEEGWVDVGFRPFRFHDLRHLHAVEWLREGRSIYDLKERLGHRSVTTTEIYLEFLTPEQQRVVKLLGTQKRTQQALGGQAG
jgi:integrase/recombinase XerD